jgi:hypothetical protein
MASSLPRGQHLHLAGMRRGLLIVVVAGLALAGAGCGDDDPPSGAGVQAVSELSGFSQIAPPKSASPEERGTARQLAQALADGIVQSSAGEVTTDGASCLVSDLVDHVSASALARISASGPDPRALPEPLRKSMVDAFTRCLPSDVAKRLASRFDPAGT